MFNWQNSIRTLFIKYAVLTFFFVYFENQSAPWDNIIQLFLAFNAIFAIASIITHLPSESNTDRPRASLDSIIDDTESTNYASVHLSATKSALNLWSLYNYQLENKRLVSSQLEQVKKWLENEVKNDNDSASLALKAYSHVVALDFTSPGSKLNLRQTLALAWVAIHDEKRRLGSLDDAKKMLLEGLAEIEKGEEVDGFERLLTDQPAFIRICSTGIFNKLMEKLEGVHPDVSIQFLTP